MRGGSDGFSLDTVQHSLLRYCPHFHHFRCGDHLPAALGGGIQAARDVCLRGGIDIYRHSGCGSCVRLGQRGSTVGEGGRPGTAGQAPAELASRGARDEVKEKRAWEFWKESSKTTSSLPRWTSFSTGRVPGRSGP